LDEEASREATFKPAEGDWYWCTSFKMEEVGSITVMSFFSQNKAHRKYW